MSIVFDEHEHSPSVLGKSESGKDNSCTNVVTVEHLRKTYGTMTAVDDLSFNVAKGEIFGLLGPNGAGKTTTVEIIEGLRKADSGHTTVLGCDITKNADSIKEHIGIQPQAPALFGLLKVEEILDLFGSVYKHAIPTRRLLDMLSLQESRKILVKNLSGGQQQRLSVAIAMVNDPDITFLDEPTTGLDPQARRNLWTVIEEMRKNGKTVILTTHYMEEAERLCGRVAIVDHGKIIALGSPDELVHKYFKESAVQFETEKTFSAESFQGLAGVTQVTIDNNEVVLYTKDIPATMSAILDFAKQKGLNGMLKNMNVRQATLEDVFLKITGRRIRE